jgi:hypothetical protein
MLRLRQTEGLMNSVIDLMGLDLPVPDHTTLAAGHRSNRPENDPPCPMVRCMCWQTARD